MHKAPMCTDITAGVVPDSIQSLWGHLLEEAPSPVPGVRRSAILLLLLFNIHLVSSFWLQHEWNLLIENFVTNFLIARFLGQQTSSLYYVAGFLGPDFCL